jgi:hypothetical protein
MRNIIKKILLEVKNQDKFIDRVLRDLNSKTSNTRFNKDFDSWSNISTFFNVHLEPYLKKVYGFNDNEIEYLEIEWLHQNYMGGRMPKIGSRIELVSMVDDENPIMKGERGTIRDYESTPWEDQIRVDWDNGRTLSLVIGLDTFKPVTESINESTDKQNKLYNYILDQLIKNIKITERYEELESPDDVIEFQYPDEFDYVLSNDEEFEKLGWKYKGEDEYGVYYEKDGIEYEWGDFQQGVKQDFIRDLIKRGELIDRGGVAVTAYPDYDINIEVAGGDRNFFTASLIREVVGGEYRLEEFGYEKFKQWLKVMYGLSKDEIDPMINLFRETFINYLSDKVPEFKYRQTEPYLKESLYEKFIDFAKEELNIGDGFSVNLTKDNSDMETLANYDIEDETSNILTKGRAPVDVIRSIGHEMTHHKQNEKGKLSGKSEEGEDGSPWEDQANAKAGELVRKFGKLHPEIYDL